LTCEGDYPRLLEQALPYLTHLEVTPDAIARIEDGVATIPAGTLAALQDAGQTVTITVHGVGLSIASHDGWSEQYVRLLDQLMAHLDVAWHSEHLGYTRVGGEHLGTMLAPPRTEAVLDLVCERIQRLQARYGTPFLLENIVHLLPDPPGEYSDAAFLNRIVARTGCGLLLDVYNLECDAHNYGFDVGGFLAQVDLRRVREVHVACGVEHRGFLLDVHSRLTRDSTIALAQRAIALAGGSVEVVTYEVLSEAVPLLGEETIVSEVRRLRDIFCG
jgi:uncharacterized protein (UPF0276 family)